MINFVTWKTCFESKGKIFLVSRPEYLVSIKEERSNWHKTFLKHQDRKKKLRQQQSNSLKYELRILYPAKLSFQYQGYRRRFSQHRSSGSVIVTVSSLVTFLLLRQNTGNPQFKGRKICFVSQFPKFQFMVGCSQWRGLLQKKAAHIQVARKQREGRSQGGRCTQSGHALCLYPGSPNSTFNHKLISGMIHPEANHHPKAQVLNT